jgi:DNA polymerase-3 subunit delta'
MSAAVTLPGLEAHPHAAAVLGAALAEGGRPAHAYLLHGPAGTGKREIARAFAAELLARGAGDPDGARTRAQHGTHPDLTWVAPSGAHEMLRRDVDEAVVSAASHTPFESRHRLFVLERADTMNDEAANALLKTLEEPPSYVVLLLLTDRPTQVLPTIASRCQGVRFDPLATEALAERLQSRGVPPESAAACARLGLGDGERALALALGDGPALRARAEAFARAPLRGAVGAELPWKPVLAQARAVGAGAREGVDAALAEELSYLPKKEHKRRETEFGERGRRAERRAETGAVDHALQLAGLWYRDMACVVAGAPELAHHADRLDALREDAEGRGPAVLQQALELVEDTRARLALNVTYELALEALGYRLERLLGPPAG